MADTSFHLLMEGLTDSPATPEYVLYAQFLRNSMGPDISSFRVNRTSPEQTSPDKEEYRKIQASIHRARYFQERMQSLDIVLAAPTPHT